jgi:signal transduction histidine kinase
MNFLNAIAGQAASAAQVSRLVAAAQGQIAGEERHRLSRELHDSLSQALYGIVLGAKSAQKRLATDPAHLAEPLDYIVDLAEAALADMRRLVLELRPESLEKEGLIVALSQCANGINSRYGLDISRQLPHEPDLPRDLKLLAYRIVQEALHNVVKHGHAEHAALRVEVENGCLAIDVTDDGEGFDPNASFAGHFGLDSMRERVKARGGEINIESSPGHGTAVRVRVPIADETSTVVGVRR